MRYTHVPVATLDRLNGLGLDAKAIYFALLTGPHRTSAPGLFRSGAANLAETCETTSEVFAACMAALEARGLVVADFDRRVVFLPHAVEDDPPDSGKNVSSWRSVLDELPPCDVTRRAWRVLHAAASTARDRAEAKPRKKGEELSPVRWEKELGPEPGGVSDTPSDAPSEGANTPTPTLTPNQNQNQNQNQIPTPTPTQPQSEESGEEEKSVRETAQPLAVFASGSDGGGAEDSSKVGTESEERLRPFVPPTREELLRVAEENGTTATEQDADEFFAHFEPRRWKHEGKPLTAENWPTAWAWFRGRRRFEMQRTLRAARGAGS